MDNMLAQLGVGGIFALLLIKEVFNYQNRRKNGPSSERCVNSPEGKAMVTNLALITEKLTSNKESIEKAVERLDDTISEFKNDLKDSLDNIAKATTENTRSTDSIRGAIEIQTKRLEDSFLSPWKK